MKSTDDICGSALIQRALARYLRQGEYAAHLERVRPHYAAIREAVREALSTVGNGLSFEDPPAGFCLLGRLEAGIDPGRFIAECRTEGIILSPGPDYWLEGTDGARAFRIGFGNLELQDIRRAVKAMEKAVRNSKNDFFERALI
jgi:GntR family transcriptional regulator/MocR family aminotransferase